MTGPCSLHDEPGRTTRRACADMRVSRDGRTDRDAPSVPPDVHGAADRRSPTPRSRPTACAISIPRSATSRTARRCCGCTSTSAGAVDLARRVGDGGGRRVLAGRPAAARRAPRRGAAQYGVLGLMAAADGRRPRAAACLMLGTARPRRRRRPACPSALLQPHAEGTTIRTRPQSMLVGRPVAALHPAGAPPSAPASPPPIFEPRPRRTLVNFFASWCVPCDEEQPALDAAQASRAVPIWGIAYKDEEKATARLPRPDGDPLPASRATSRARRRSTSASTACRRPTWSIGPGSSAGTSAGRSRPKMIAGTLDPLLRNYA